MSLTSSILPPATLDYAGTPRAPADFPRIAGEIYRRRRLGQRVLAHVGAADDALLLRQACERIGLPVSIGADTRGDVVIVPRPAAPPLRIALAGYGVVGQALAQRLAAEPGFRIVAILVRDLARPRAFAPPCPLTDDADAFLAVAADVIIDALSCESTGNGLCGAVLPAGVHVVSASKRVISEHRERLADAARRGGASLLYSASVGGAAPVLETVGAARRHGPVRKVEAVLNGTVNYILDRLHEGLDFPEALTLAQRAGFAEEDPSADLSGADAAAKLRLIAAEAFEVDPRSVAVKTQPLDAEVVERITRSGERWVQLARLCRTNAGIEASVKLVPAIHVPQLPLVPDEWNCAAITTRDGAVFRCIGRGAGGAATAEAIVADLFQIAEREEQVDLPRLLAC